MARDSKGRWLPGESANPRGAAPGSTWQAKLRRALAGDMPAIAARLTEMALGGDVQAAEALMKRCLPNVREDPVVLPWADGDSIEARSEAVLRAVATGAVTTEQAGRLALLLKAHADISSLAEMRAELDELKGKLR